MHGSCLCGAVTFDVSGEARSVVACHCTQCRKTSGHYVAATQVERDAVTIRGAENVKWYSSSAKAQRAFCRICGSQLFWTLLDSGFISIMAGSIDGDTGLHMDSQLYPDAKGDYYALPNVPVVRQETLKT